MLRLVFGEVLSPHARYTPSEMTEPFLELLLQLLNVPNSVICVQALEVRIYMGLITLTAIITCACRCRNT